MSTEVAVYALPENTSGIEFLVWLLGGVWIGTLVVGFVLGWVCCRTPTRTSAANEGALVAWERLTNKAIRFVNKRRKVGLAFNGYKRYSLRNTEGSRPTGARTSRRRSTTPGAPLLHEGPALTDGPHRRRAPGNQQFG